MNDVNRLVEELHASMHGAPDSSSEAIRLIGWLEQVGGADLLLVAGAPARAEHPDEFESALAL